LHEEERRLHDSRLPGEQTADAYLIWMLAEAARDGAVFVAEASGVFAGFAAGWIVQENVIEETPDSNRFGYVSDVCVLPAFRGRRIAALLLEALEARLSLGGGEADSLVRAGREPRRPNGVRTLGLRRL
jgi:ribosomal protein S18 acetylase RimI-like enzyme